MDQRKIYYKTDFKIWERSEIGFKTPFKFTYYTSNPNRTVIASYDGEKYTGCSLMDDDRLCVAFDDHCLGFGVLRVERRFYLSDSDYKSGICDEIHAPAPVVCEDGDTPYNLCLSLSGSKAELNITTVVPPCYVKGENGEDAKINGVNTIWIKGEAVEQSGNVLEINAYSKESVDCIASDKAEKEDVKKLSECVASLSSTCITATFVLDEDYETWENYS